MELSSKTSSRVNNCFLPIRLSVELNLSFPADPLTTSKLSKSVVSELHKIRWSPDLDCQKIGRVDKAAQLSSQALFITFFFNMGADVSILRGHSPGFNLKYLANIQLPKNKSL